MISAIFREKFGADAEFLAQSPGRINLIGEHTDYNDGFVLPAAIDKYAKVAVGKRSDGLVHLYSAQYGSEHRVELAAIGAIPQSWTNYILGVADELMKAGHRLSGFNLALEGDVPVGAGLSSSASVECAVCFALSRLFNLQLSRFEIAKIAQKAEHGFPGVQCGIMDQFASVFGKKDAALKLDCRTLEYEEVPLALNGHVLLLLNTNVHHALSSSAYNTRREECMAGAAAVAKHVAGVRNLRDVTLAMLEEYVHDPLILKRCRYVIQESARVFEAVEQLRSGSIAGLGRLMYKSHDGLSKEYEVSCPELDFLVDAVRNDPAVAGARMMGGGFGGCTINIVREEAVPALRERVARQYRSEMGRELSAYVATTAQGTGPLTDG